MCVIFAMDFFVRHNEGSQPEGPYSKSRVVEMLKNGDLPDNSTYWHEGMSDWQSVKNGLIGPMRIVLDVPEGDSPSDSSAPPVIGSPEGPPVLPQPISSSQGISWMLTTFVMIWNDGKAFPKGDSVAVLCVPRLSTKCRVARRGQDL